MQSPATPPGPIGGTGLARIGHTPSPPASPRAAPGTKSCPKFSPTSAGRLRKVQLFGAEQELGKGCRDDKDRQWLLLLKGCRTARLNKIIKYRIRNNQIFLV